MGSKFNENHLNDRTGVVILLNEYVKEVDLSNKVGGSHAWYLVFVLVSEVIHNSSWSGTMYGRYSAILKGWWRNRREDKLLGH